MTTKLRYAYFPGCSASSTGLAYTMSAAYVAERVNLELLEIPDWCCCGTSAALMTDELLSHSLSARSLALAEAMAVTAVDGSKQELDVVAPCAGCYASLKAASHQARLSEQNRRQLEQIIELPWSARAEVLSILELLSQPELQQRLQQGIVASLGGLRVACYYGCALVRPVEVCKFDDAENPQSMDRLMAMIGAEPVRWAFKTECCGASHQISQPKGARRLIERILEDAMANGAEAIATACPLCMLNLDMRQAEINRGRDAAGDVARDAARDAAAAFDLPVYYFTELLGLALGGQPKQLGIDKHFWPAARAAEAVAKASTLASPGQDSSPPDPASPDSSPPDPAIPANQEVSAQ